MLPAGVRRMMVIIFRSPIEGDFVLEWRRLLQRLFGHAEFRRQHEQRSFGRITDDVPGSVLLVQYRAITQHSRREQLPNARSAAWKWKSFIGHLEGLIADADFRDRHFVFRYVPVLSVQITVAEPSVLTAGSLLISA